MNGAWLPVVAILQGLGPLIVVMLSSVSETTVSETTADGATVTSTSSHWDVTGWITYEAVSVMWLWIPIAVLVGLSGLWGSRAKTLQIALLPLAVLLFAIPCRE